MDDSKLEEIETLKEILKMSTNEQQQYLIKNDLKKQQKVMIMILQILKHKQNVQEKMELSFIQKTVSIFLLKQLL